jgi:hypothetical protein
VENAAGVFSEGAEKGATFRQALSIPVSISMIVASG